VLAVLPVLAAFVAQPTMVANASGSTLDEVNKCLAMPTTGTDGQIGILSHLDAAISESDKVAWCLFLYEFNRHVSGSQTRGVQARKLCQRAATQSIVGLR
jgi:hypothetical protein